MTEKELHKRKIFVKCTFLYVGSIFFFLSGIFIYMWPHIAIIEKSYKVESLKSIVSNLETEGRLLNLEIAALNTLERVENIAKNRYGLKPLNISNVIYLKREAR